MDGGDHLSMAVGEGYLEGSDHLSMPVGDCLDGKDHLSMTVGIMWMAVGGTIPWLRSRTL